MGLNAWGNRSFSAEKKSIFALNSLILLKTQPCITHSHTSFSFLHLHACCRHRHVMPTGQNNRTMKSLTVEPRSYTVVHSAYTEGSLMSEAKGKAVCLKKQYDPLWGPLTHIWA